MTSYLPQDATALTLGVPRKWFRREVEAGRIPFLQIGKRRLFDVDAVSEALKQRETVLATEGGADA